MNNEILASTYRHAREVSAKARLLSRCRFVGSLNRRGWADLRKTAVNTAWSVRREIREDASRSWNRQ